MTASSIANVITPIFYGYIGQDDYVLLSTKLLQAMRFMGLFFGLPVAVAAGLFKPLIVLWLDESFIELWPLVLGVIFSTWAGGICFIPVGIVFRGMNRNVVPAVSHFIFGIFHLISTYVLIVYYDLGLMGFVISFIVFFGIRNILINGLYVARLLKVSSLQFFNMIMILIFLVVSCSMVANLQIIKSIEHYSLQVLSQLFLVAGLYSITGYLLILSRDDRNLLKSLFLKSTRK
jgi:O-antigen/teichoic acid export membrane protein